MLEINLWLEKQRSTEGTSVSKVDKCYLILRKVLHLIVKKLYELFLFSLN